MPSISKSIRRQAGFTLLELVLVVAIGAVLVGLGLVVVPSLLNSSKVRGEATDIPLTINKIQKLYSGRATYADVTQSTIIGLSVVPDAFVSGTTITNRWGGSVTMAPLAAGLINPNDAMTYTTTAIPSEACVELAQSIEKTMHVIQVSTGGAPVTVKPHNSALSLDLLGTNCSAASTVTMVFTFGK